MKKNLLGLFIAAIAIGLFAFTDLQKSMSNLPKGTVKQTTTSFYWYAVVGNQTSGSRLNSTPVDKDDAMANLTDCEDLATDYCLFGSTNANLPSGTIIQNPVDEQIITKNE